MSADLEKTPSTTLIVGGTSTVGKAIVRQFCAAGESVIGTYCNSMVDQNLMAASWLELDLARDASIQALNCSLAQANIRLDKVIFVAGILPGRSLEDYTPGEMEAAMTINFLGQAKCLKSLLSLLNVPSQIIMMSSISGERGSYDPIYAASKGAIIAFAKSLATWLPPRIRCLSVAPDAVMGSGMYLSMSAATRQAHREGTPLKELITPESLAKIILDLTRTHWAHANGSCVRINGGAYV